MPWNGETVMNRDELKVTVKEYMNDLLKALHEPILKREIGDFPVDAKKAFFAMLPLMNESKMTDELRNTALSIGAVHAALDVHDRILTKDATSAEQQLTVLAGDHFSGIHYQILAKNREFGFIRELSRTIAHINEQKTALQHESHLTEARLLERVVVIESACITSFYSAKGFDRYIPLAQTVLTYERLMNMMQPQPLHTLQVDDCVVQQALSTLKPKLVQQLEAMNFLEQPFQNEVRDIVISQSSQS